MIREKSVKYHSVFFYCSVRSYLDIVRKCAMFNPTLPHLDHNSHFVRYLSIVHFLSKHIQMIWPPDDRLSGSMVICISCIVLMYCYLL